MPCSYFVAEGLITVIRSFLFDFNTVAGHLALRRVWTVNAVKNEPFPQLLALFNNLILTDQRREAKVW